MAKGKKECGEVHETEDNHLSVKRVGETLAEPLVVFRVHTCRQDHSGDVVDERNRNATTHYCTDDYCNFHWVTVK